MKHYLGMYDISCDRARRRVFRILAAYGIHQQKSVFECRLDFVLRHALFEQLDLATEDTYQRILLIQIFPNHPDTVLFGEAKRMPSSNCLLIA